MMSSKSKVHLLLLDIDSRYEQILQRVLHPDSVSRLQLDSE